MSTTIMLVSCGTSTIQDPTPVSSPSLSPDTKITSPQSTSTPIGSAAPTIVATEERSAEELWSLLQQAEAHYAVLIRHAIAPGTGDPPNFQLEDCSTQRNLSEDGRQQARQMGEAFRSRNIPIDSVLSSQWCRCLETAELMNLGEVEPFPPLNSFFNDRSTANEQTVQVQQFLLENRDIPGVTILVSHQVNITALSDVFPPSGGAVVLQIEDDNPLTILGQLPVLQ